MRDPELLIDLLKEMSDDDLGRMIVPLTMGADKNEFNRHHHAELLVDAGHADWTSMDQQVVRITNAGYDFLAAVDKQPKAKKRFLDLFNTGASYVQAALKAIELANSLGA